MTRGVLNGKLKRRSVPLQQFLKILRVTHVFNCHGLAVGDWWRLAVGGGCRLAVGGSWWLVVGGWWQLAVGGWASLRAVLKEGP